MASMATEFESELGELSDAIDEFKKNPSEETCGMICVRTRAAIATFKMYCVWSREVDEEMQRDLVAKLTAAVLVLKPRFTNDARPGSKYYKRIRERLIEAKQLSIEMIKEKV